MVHRICRANKSTGWAKKPGTLCLTVHIFKTRGQIRTTFGTLQYCFVLDESVNFILNKLITQVAAPSNKSWCFAIGLEKPARSLYRNTQIFKRLG